MALLMLSAGVPMITGGDEMLRTLEQRKFPVSKLVALAAEVGDGLIGHPMWSAKWTLEKMKPEFEAELDRNAPPVDTVRSWQAPYPGRVRISGEVRLAQAQRTGANAV